MQDKNNTDQVVDINEELVSLQHLGLLPNQKDENIEVQKEQKKDYLEQKNQNLTQKLIEVSSQERKNQINLIKPIIGEFKSGTWQGILGILIMEILGIMSEIQNNEQLILNVSTFFFTKIGYFLVWIADKTKQKK